MKHNLDPGTLNNFRPISNLSYVSKLVEQAIVQQLTAYMSENNPYDPEQSAYHSFHSTEFALICILDELLVSLDERNQVFISLLDYSAAFDLVVHHILLHRLKHWLGLSGTVLDWLISYLTDKSQQMSISGHKSSSHTLNYGVPQCPVLGPILFTIYTLPVGDIIRAHNTGYHLYADDTQLFLSCNKHSCPDSRQLALAKLKACITDMDVDA